MISKIFHTYMVFIPGCDLCLEHELFKVTGSLTRILFDVVLFH